MAFTVSHMLFAPVIYRLSQRQFPLAATGIGCMTPDLFRLFTHENIMISHLWQGLIFPDLSSLVYCFRDYGMVCIAL